MPHLENRKICLPRQNNGGDRITKWVQDRSPAKSMRSDPSCGKQEAISGLEFDPL